MHYRILVGKICFYAKRNEEHKIESNKTNYLWEYSVTLSTGRVQVCRKLILSLFQISEKRLRTVQETYKDNKFILKTKEENTTPERT